jgi:hypothetical protein
MEWLGRTLNGKQILPERKLQSSSTESTEQSMRRRKAKTTKGVRWGGGYQRTDWMDRRGCRSGAAPGVPHHRIARWGGGRRTGIVEGVVGLQAAWGAALQLQRRTRSRNGCSADRIERIGEQPGGRGKEKGLVIYFRLLFPVHKSTRD